MRARAFGIVAAAWFLLMAGVNLATPLYAVYRRELGFSSAVLTLIFAVYALALVPSLLLFGPLSDRVGRRRMIAAGLTVAVCGLALFASARGLWWLFAARGVQGLAVGMTSGAAGAALVELERGTRGRAALLAALAQAGGSAAGPVCAGLLAEWAPAPRRLCFVVGVGATAVALLAALPSTPGTGGGWAIQRPSVPAEIRARFALVAITGAVVWAVAALFLSVVPSYAGSLLHTANLALLGAVSALMLATSCAAQLAAERRAIPSRHAQPAGLALLLGGLVALVAAFPTHSLVVLLAGALLAGRGPRPRLPGRPGRRQPDRPARAPRRADRSLLHLHLSDGGGGGDRRRGARPARLAVPRGHGVLAGLRPGGGARRRLARRYSVSASQAAAASAWAGSMWCAASDSW